MSRTGVRGTRHSAVRSQVRRKRAHGAARCWRRRRSCRRERAGEPELQPAPRVKSSRAHDVVGGYCGVGRDAALLELGVEQQDVGVEVERRVAARARRSKQAEEIILRARLDAAMHRRPTLPTLTAAGQRDCANLVVELEVEHARVEHEPGEGCVLYPISYCSARPSRGRR